MERSHQPAAGSGPAGRAIGLAEKLPRLLRDSAIQWNACKAPRLGAALAYYTIFSLAPLLIIAILISGALFGQAAAQDQIFTQISYLIGPAGASGVAALLQQRSFPGSAGTLATVVSVVTLTLGAIGMFGQLEDAFNTVWEVTPPPATGLRGYVRKRLMPFGMVLAVGFLLLVATLLNTALAAMSSFLGARLPSFGLLDAALNIALPLAVITLLFAALFKFVPAVHLAWRDLWPGAALTAALFTLGKIAFGLYVGHSNLGNASGAAGSLLVLLVWIYYSAQILLYGAVFTHVYARDHRPGPNPPSAVVEARAPGRGGAPATRGTPGANGMWRASRAAAGASVLDAPPRADSGWRGTLLGFVAGLGAGILVAWRKTR